MISTGIEHLDNITGGLKLGDNVVWQISDGIPIEFFIKSFFNDNKQFNHNIIYINFNYSPQTILNKYGDIFENEKVILVDAFTHGKGNSDTVFLDFYSKENTIEALCLENPRDVSSFISTLNTIEKTNRQGCFYIFDSLTGMNELWKDENAVLDFFTFTCPKLYDLNTLAYWIYEKDAHSKEFIAGLTHITQIVFSLGLSSAEFFELKINKLENRPSFDPEPNYFKITNKKILFKDKKSSQVRIGEKIKEQRKMMKLTQSELAAHLEMTPGAVSQIENDITTPSLPTLIQLSALFKKPIDFFLGIDFSQNNFNITKKTDIKSNKSIIISKLLEEDGIIQPYSVIIKKGASISGPIILHKGNEFLTVTEGSIHIIIDNESHRLEKGDSLFIKKTYLSSIENVDNTDAEFIYVLY